jgi:Flp pilus assembly protein TadB
VDTMTQLRLMALSGLALLYGLALAIAFGIKALYKRRERQQSTLPAAVDAVPVGLIAGDAPAYTVSVMTPAQGGPFDGTRSS